MGLYRKTCSQLHCLYMGPQELKFLLVGHEGVRSSSNTRSELGRANSCPHRQPILADEVQTFKALITIHKVLQEGHPVVLKEAQTHTTWLESLKRGVAGGDGLRGMPTAGARSRRTSYTKQVDRLCSSDLRIYLLPPRKACVPQAAPRVQWQAHKRYQTRVLELTDCRNFRIRRIHQSKIHQ
jgi:hypothetical protein